MAEGQGQEWASKGIGLGLGHEWISKGIYRLRARGIRYQAWVYT